jgi:hypothetical protein
MCSQEEKQKSRASAASSQVTETWYRNDTVDDG